MVNVVKSTSMGSGEHGWLHSRFHFSFAEYYNPDNMRFGALRVLNDDVFDAYGGFDTHPHDNMEILSYVVQGELTHRDSLGNGNRLGRGDVQYMSAGTGILHSEFNKTEHSLRFLQIWITPDEQNLDPDYGDRRFAWEDRVGTWLLVASGSQDGPIRVHQDVRISVSAIGEGEELRYDLEPGRQAYLVQIEGEGTVNGFALEEGDAAEITAEREVVVRAVEPSHYILLDLAAE